MPALEAELTPEWLQMSGVLDQIESDDAGFTTERIGADYGLASEIYRLHWNDNPVAPAVVVKLWDTNSRAGETEVHFYRTVGRRLGIRVPACYYAAVDPDRQRGIVVLEDLKDVVQGDVLEQAGAEQAAAIARALAVMHARWAGAEALSTTEWLQSLAVWEPDPEWVASHRSLFLERFADRLDELGRALLARIDEAQHVANARLAGAPETLLHAELHLDNIVFERGTEPVLLDWARCARGPQAIDLYELLFAMGSPDDIEQTLRAYAAAFEAESGEAIDLDRLRHELGGAFLRRFAVGTCGTALWNPTAPREKAMIDDGIERMNRSLHYWNDHDQALFSAPHQLIRRVQT